MNEFGEHGKLLAIWIAIVTVAVFLADIVLPLGVAGGVPYVVPVLFALWLPDRRHIFYVAAVATLFTVLGFFISAPGSMMWMVLVNRSYALLAIWSVALVSFESKRAEEALKESEHHYIQLFEGVPDAVMVYSHRGMFLDCNESSIKLFGYSREDLRHMGAMNIVHPDFHERLKENMEAIWAGKSIVVESVNVSEDGRVFPVEVNSHRIEYEGESAILSVVRDISERKRAEEELNKYSKDLEESNRLKDLFIDILRHDLLNPAGTVKTMTELALKVEDDSKKKEFIQLAVRSNRRVISMIENASLLATLETGQKLEMEELDLSDVLRTAVKEMTSLADEKKSRILLDADGEFRVVANPLIHDVFSNLISNALKYGPENSEVSVGIVESDSNWKVSVADKGEGILDEDKESVFDRFKRIEKGSVEGTGLGLAIVKRVVGAHGGRVWVEDNPGGGSVFFFTLPKEQ